MELIYSSLCVVGFICLLLWFIRIQRNKAKPKQHKPLGQAYNLYGINQKGQYNRLYDRAVFRTKLYSREGFLDPKQYPVGVTDHARERMAERLGLQTKAQMDALALNAYQYGKSALQVPKRSAQMMREIEQRYEGERTVLLYQSTVFIFSADNALITVYPNTNIRL